MYHQQRRLPAGTCNTRQSAASWPAGILGAGPTYWQGAGRQRREGAGSARAREALPRPPAPQCDLPVRASSARTHTRDSTPVPESDADTRASSMAPFLRTQGPVFDASTDRVMPAGLVAVRATALPGGVAVMVGAVVSTARRQIGQSESRQTSHQTSKMQCPDSSSSGAACRRMRPSAGAHSSAAAWPESGPRHHASRVTAPDRASLFCTRQAEMQGRQRSGG